MRQQLHKGVGGRRILDFSQGFDHGELNPLLIVHGLAKSVHSFGIGQRAETYSRLITHIDFRVLEQRVAEQQHCLMRVAITENISKEDTQIRVIVM